MAELPEKVAARLLAQFPGAKVLDWELSRDDGESEYDLDAELNGRTFHATLSSAGVLIETRGAPPRVAPAPEVDSVAREAVDRLPPAPLPALPTAPSPAEFAVEVVGIDPVESGDNDRRLSPSQLPTPVKVALDALFPGAKVTAAEFGADGDGWEVGIHGEFNGKPIDLAFTPRGELKESQHALTEQELPKAVLDWIRQNYPGARIGEIDAVTRAGVVNYEVQIDPPGKHPVEATLHLDPSRDAGVPKSALAPDPAGAPPAPRVASATGKPSFFRGAGANQFAEAWSLPAVPERAVAREAPAEHRPRPESNEDGGTFGYAPRQAAAGAGDTDATELAAKPTSRPSDSPPAPAVAPHSDAVPQLADALAVFLPADAAGVEPGLRRLLDDIESAARRAGTATSSHGLAVRLVAVAALAGVAELCAVHWKKPRYGTRPVAASTGTRWGWAIGSTVPKRRQH